MHDYALTPRTPAPGPARSTRLDPAPSASIGATLSGLSEPGAGRHSPRGTLSAHVALWAVQVLFATLPTLGKLAMTRAGSEAAQAAAGELFHPRAVAAWRMLVGGAVLLACAFARYGQKALPERADLGRLFLYSLLGVALNQVLFLEGLQRSTAVNAGLIVALIPVMTFAVAALLGHERFRAWRALGVVVAMAGSLLMLFARAPTASAGGAPGSGALAGNLMMLANSLAYSFYLVLSRPLLARLPPLVVIGWVFALSWWCVPLLLLGAPELVPAAASGATWGALGLILALPTIGAYLLVLWALARVPASTAAVYNYVQLLIIAALAVVLLDEPIPPVAALVALLNGVGIWLVARDGAERTAPRRRAVEPGE